jgi:hypothetical protein
MGCERALIMATILQGHLRRIIVYALVYALSQGVINVGSLAFGGANSTERTGFDLCTHSGATTAPAVPPQGPIGDVHCVFCPAGVVFLNCTPPCMLQCRKIVLTNADWLLAAPHLVAFFVVESAWPRGPPVAA